ncbi:large subunit ribosomal protein L23 [Senna tora]|uniref:Large ribosomal subunit protein uL23m n=1 Tax=Senna tora TaxID=362788 RepID=A0A834WXA3_9FABA|nr:large subunit ribosomal protein L23 [Senna tora]
MGSRLGRRVVHFANLPIKLLMPSSFTNIKEIALKTIPSASKIEIKRVLESLYGFDVEKVQTLNMDGKKKKYGGILIAKPDYKKAYVTLRTPLSLSPDLFPLRMIEEEKRRVNKQSKSSLVEEGETKRHWLDGNKESERSSSDRRGSRAHGGGRRGDRADAAAPAAKFPWSSMRSGSARVFEVEILWDIDSLLVLILHLMRFEGFG